MGSVLNGAAVQADEDPWSLWVEGQTLGPAALALELYPELVEVARAESECLALVSIEGDAMLADLGNTQEGFKDKL